MNGFLTSLTFHFPSGCNALVGVRFKVDGRSYYPYKGALFLNDATPVYNFPEEFWLPVTKQQALQVDIDNGDTLNAHTISVIATVVGRT